MWSATSAMASKLLGRSGSSKNIGVYLLDGAAQRDRFGRRQAAVDFDAEVDLGTDCFAQPPDVSAAFRFLCMAS